MASKFKYIDSEKQKHFHTKKNVNKLCFFLHMVVCNGAAYSAWAKHNTNSVYTLLTSFGIF